ncbi:uncharacterized protein LOC131651665 [Vicia villosa]|uniref:uncharacterized protein LOC131651665 n=1 Tax=Vicia villosa TaxID=3911 RepID=UPI00273ABC80|nr:uncharacterized protein LOC131651665 [Vicia villosa]
MIWNNESEDFSKLGLHAFCSWQEWFVAQENTSREHEHSHSLSWSPPMEGSLKCNVDAAGVLALKEAILSAIDLHLVNVIFECDSQVMTQAIRSDFNGFSEFSSIISAIRSLLLHFPNFEVKFVKRQANSVAHALAKAADSWTRRSFFNMSPPCIEHLLTSDMS